MLKPAPVPPLSLRERLAVTVRFPRRGRGFWYGRLWPRRSVRVLAGPPVELPRPTRRVPSRSDLDTATQAIMAAVTGLLGELRDECPPGDPAAA